MKRIIHSLILIVITIPSIAQEDLTYYLPAGIEYDAKIPTPKDIIGHEVGEWHISHDRLVNYMYAIAEASDRITIEKYAETFEARPLLLLTITSPDNQKDIEKLKSEHVALTDPNKSGALDIKVMPAVAYLGYSVHGNEASGSNAALLVAYYLAAAQGAEIESLLQNTVILLDPSFNPDGLNRFAHWVNSRKSYNTVSDPYNMEQNEPWPRGRTNHYWFDLNRDWLPVQLPESRGRIAKFHEWKPNVLTDHHEMGTNSTFFFQPGIPSRNNPLTPENTYRLTDRMGEYHAKALDKIGSLYYTRESFDDYYYGKGSTYPDINGAVGILFEQASSRGHAQESIHGVVKFPFTIKNHFTTSLSTLEAVKDMREDFLKHQRDFYKNSAQEAASDSEKAYIFASKDRCRAYHLAELLDRHKIKVHHNGKPVVIDGQRYSENQAFTIPLNQNQYKLIKAMFEKRTDFVDSLFYDVSTWTLSFAFGMDFHALTSRTFDSGFLGKEFSAKDKPVGSVIGGKSQYAYAFEWYGYYTPKILYSLLKRGYKAKVANEEFFGSDGKQFARGTIIIPVGIQSKDSQIIYDDLQQLAQINGVDIYSLNTGLDYKGVSLGSPSFSNVEKPSVMILVDNGVSGYDAGEVWHLFDQRYDIDLSLVPINEFNYADIDRYNTILMVSGSYNDISSSAKDKMKVWIEKGGTVVASKNAMRWLSSQNLAKFDFKKIDLQDSTKSMRYADISPYRGAQEIGGSIFEATIDTTHPLLYGYYKSRIPLFKNSELFLEKSKNPFANPVVYTSSPLLSGYISEENLEKLKNTSAVGVSTLGRGRVIGFTDNLNFRAFWYGTNKIFMNAVFFGSDISRSASR